MRTARRECEKLADAGLGVVHHFEEEGAADDVALGGAWSSTDY